MTLNPHQRIVLEELDDYAPRSIQALGDAVIEKQPSVWRKLWLGLAYHSVVARLLELGLIKIARESFIHEGGPRVKPTAAEVYVEITGKGVEALDRHNQVN